MPGIHADRRFDDWLAALEKRHTADLQFAEVTRALRALSSGYVERRARLLERGAFDSAGKRAAYALFYGPLHYLTVQGIVHALGAAAKPIPALLDLGCGAGAAGAAWAMQAGGTAAVTGVDMHPWALREASFTYRFFGLDGDVRRGRIGRVAIPRGLPALIAGWVLNEIDDASRRALQPALLAAAAAGTRVLIVEPIATRVAPWWDDWAAEFARLGGRDDEWRFPVDLPDALKRLDRAAGLRHDQLKARSLYLSASFAAPS